MKLLLVDDEQSIIEIFSQVLMKGGYQVITAMSGKDALDKVKVEQPNIILLDQILPDMSGNDILKVLKSQELTKNIPVAILSNYSDDRYMQEAIQAGATDYILKYQIEPNDILQKIQQMVQETQTQTTTTPTPINPVQSA